MPILNSNSTNYVHPWEPNLADLHLAMGYNAGGQPALRNLDFNLAVAQGRVPGVSALNISGYSSSVGLTFIPAWGNDTPYVYFPSAQAVRIWSDSALDTNISVEVQGLDSNYVQQTETVLLNNGVTGVLSTKQFLRVNRLRLTRAPNNVGLIHASNNNKSITLAYINNPTTGLSAGISQMTVYTVPAGYTFYLTQSNWYVGGNQSGLYRSWTQAPDGLITIVLNFPITTEYNSTKVVARPYTEKTDIQWQVSASNNIPIGGQIEGYLISNTYL